MKFQRYLALLLSVVLVASVSFAQPSTGFESGNLTGKSAEAKANIALKFMQKRGFEGEFKIINETKDEMGITTVRVQQYFNGIPVFGSDQIVNIEEDGVVDSFVGLPIKSNGKISQKALHGIKQKDALNYALLDLGFSPELVNEPSPELIIYPLNGQYHYAYAVELVFDNPTPGRWFYFISTENGNVIDKYNTITTAKPVPTLTFNPANTVVATGKNVLGVQTSFNTNRHTDGKYYVVDMTRGKGIFTYNANYRTTLPGTLWTDIDNMFNVATDATAVSSQANLGTVYDYYKSKFNRNSFDNLGAQIKSSVHVGSSYNNAYWNGTQFAFGDGDGSVFIPLSGALDVVAHEFQHAVTSKTANLIYKDQSGALNEALSDIFGTAVEFYANSQPEWLVGEDIAGPGLGTPALRSLADPAAYGDPDHISKIYVGTADYGGVHTNCGVINKVAYLIGNGGTHYGITVQGQGVEVMEKVFFRALTTYMTSSTNFAGGKLACVKAATDLYGAASPQVKAVTDAFTACGIQ